ncbi:MAG: hypothetical protein K2Z81_13595, partial [Cyanobacteria bacterium]|nr:hypothetical protein [Cyanobacteriota bacterium]
GGIEPILGSECAVWFSTLSHAFLKHLTAPVVSVMKAQQCQNVRFQWCFSQMPETLTNRRITSI